MEKIHAIITGVGAYLPDYRLTNEELSRMVDTSDEWIMERIGIKERRIQRERGKATSDMGVEAVRDLFGKTGTKPEEVDLLICATVTPDMRFPATSCLIADKLGIRNAFAFDLTSGCSGFVYALSTAARYVESGRYKKVVLVGSEKMSSMIDYTDRATCPIFGDGAGAVLLEPTTEEYGVLDEVMGTDGCGAKHLHMKAGGSLYPPTHETVDKRWHYVYQEGQAVFKWAVVKMADVAEAVVKRNNLDPAKVWIAPHQANLRIINREHDGGYYSPFALGMGIEIEKRGRHCGLRVWCWIFLGGHLAQVGLLVRHWGDCPVSCSMLPAWPKA